MIDHYYFRSLFVGLAVWFISIVVIKFSLFGCALCVVIQLLASGPTSIEGGPIDWSFVWGMVYKGLFPWVMSFGAMYFAIKDGDLADKNLLRRSRLFLQLTFLIWLAQVAYLNPIDDVRLLANPTMLTELVFHLIGPTTILFAGLVLIREQKPR